jgi:hypothetical protein
MVLMWEDNHPEQRYLTTGNAVKDAKYRNLNDYLALSPE